jgi:demethylmenaquinone methyltransferase/2-methoxy-6-polyprenyl-1,4-benzoquinol methylase
MTESIDFGYRQVPLEQKQGMVKRVFESVAGRYDLMNDFMSLGVHRAWKRFTIAVAGLRPGQRVLDLAGGTGDLSSKIAPLVGPEGSVMLADINPAMLRVGRDRLIDEGIVNNVSCVQVNAESLAFPDNSFDRIFIAFGLRNVTRKDKALAAMYRALRPGGRLLILEFSQVAIPVLKQIYDRYSFSILPWLGERVAGDRDSYQYLVESIRRHPDQETLKAMMSTAGLENVSYQNMSGGIVALHSGYKF